MAGRRGNLSPFSRDLRLTRAAANAPLEVGSVTFRVAPWLLSRTRTQTCSMSWADIRRQLLGYKLDDRKLEQDGVMTLAMAAWHASRNPETPLENAAFSYFGGD